MTTIAVTVLDDDPEVLDRQIRLLRDDLRGLDVDVALEPGPPAPAEAKGDPQVSGTIVVTDGTSPALLELGRVLADFADRGPRKVVVRAAGWKLEIEGPLDDTEKQAVESFFTDIHPG